MRSSKKCKHFFDEEVCAVLCASVVCPWQTIRRSLREKYFLPRRSV